MISILGIPYDESSSYLTGCRLGPDAIRKALNCKSSNTFAENEVQVVGHPAIHDAGDIQLGQAEDVRTEIETRVTELLRIDRRVLSLGGDHSITYPILKAYHRKFPKLNVLHLDAHPDLYDQLDGDRYSHACPFARSMEDGLINRLVQVGIRTMNGHQRQQASRFGVEVVTMKEWTPTQRFLFDGPIYLSLDLDVLDPAHAPGISHYEPGGFSTRQLLRLIQSLDIELVGADIVELNPTRDTHNMTAMVAAKILKEILAKMLLVV